MERKRIDPERILRSFKTLSHRHQFMIVEGAGGIMVPLAKGYLFLDLAEAMGLPVVIIARPGLGTINHTLLTIEVLRSRGLMIAGVVINDGQGGQQGLAEATSPAVIQELSGVPIIGAIAYRSRTFAELLKNII
jgi:dethiobiotin synthetase